jgi:hypothetical protein
MIPKKALAASLDHVRLLVRDWPFINKGPIIGLDPSKISKPPKLRSATGDGRIQCPYLAGTSHCFERQYEHHRTQIFKTSI